MAIDSIPTMPSVRNATARLSPLSLLTAPLPRFGQSVVRFPASSQPESGIAVSTKWSTYAQHGTFTSLHEFLPSQKTAMLKHSKLVLIGEQHHQPAILNLQLQTLDLLSSLHPDRTVLVVEYFDLQQSRLIGDFMEHRVDIPELASRYAESSEGFDILGHLALLLLLAREKRIPVIPGFPPREWAREFLTDPGRESVLARLKEQYGFDREVGSSGWRHEAYFESLLSGEPPRRSVEDGGVRRGARIFPAQVLKDSVMAWKIDEQLALGKFVVGIAGIGHLEYGFGIMERLREVKRQEISLVACKSNEGSEFWAHEDEGRGEEMGEDAETESRIVADAVYLYDAV